jgi:hypothetical protein
MHQNLIETISAKSGRILLKPFLQISTKFLMPGFLLFFFLLLIILFEMIKGLAVKYEGKMMVHLFYSIHLIY